MDNVTVIRLAMERKGMTRAELARQTRIDSGLIGRYLSGKNAIGMKNAPKIAAALGLSTAQVLLGEQQEEETPSEAA